MPMTEFPRFAMDDSGACSGKRACDLANYGAYPSAFGRKQGWQSWPASRSLAHPKIMERGRGGRDSVEVHAQWNTDFQVCAPNRHSCLFCSYSNTAGSKLAGRTGKHACVPSASVGRDSVEPKNNQAAAAEDGR